MGSRHPRQAGSNTNGRGRRVAVGTAPRTVDGCLPTTIRRGGAYTRDLEVTPVLGRTLRVLLVVLNPFLAITAIIGGVWVIPTLPRNGWRYSIQQLSDPRSSTGSRRRLRRAHLGDWPGFRPLVGAAGVDGHGCGDRYLRNCRNRDDEFAPLAAHRRSGVGTPHLGLARSISATGSRFPCCSSLSTSSTA
jgi:hypothetical protein